MEDLSREVAELRCKNDLIINDYEMEMRKLLAEVRCLRAGSEEERGRYAEGLKKREGKLQKMEKEQKVLSLEKEELQEMLELTENQVSQCIKELDIRAELVCKFRKNAKISLNLVK